MINGAIAAGTGTKPGHGQARVAASDETVGVLIGYKAELNAEVAKRQWTSRRVAS